MTAVVELEVGGQLAVARHRRIRHRDSVILSVEPATRAIGRSHQQVIDVLIDIGCLAAVHHAGQVPGGIVLVSDEPRRAVLIAPPHQIDRSDPAGEVVREVEAVPVGIFEFFDATLTVVEDQAVTVSVFDRRDGKVVANRDANPV